MITADIPRYRLHNQFLSQTDFTEPSQVVAQLGAVQSQDYAGAKWALGLRTKGTTDTAIDRAFNAGKILRTHLLRPTWHFVTPEDIRWILALTAPRVHAVNAFMYRKLELDPSVIRKSYTILEKVLQGGRQLTRAELGSALEQAGIYADGQRLGYIMMSAELDGLICSGARQGKQFTYVLLEERAPTGKALRHDEALAELVRRYFRTRGPATLQDFSWWSGLTATDAQQGIQMVKPQFDSAILAGKTYWFHPSESYEEIKSSTAYLLPNYDEYFIGFRDRSAIGEAARKAGIKRDDPALIAHVIVLNGQIVGGWKRTLKKDRVSITLRVITQLSKAEGEAITDAANQYGRFLGLSVDLAVEVAKGGYSL